MAKKNNGTVGIIGLGIMGGAFARNLAGAGWRVIGYDPSKAATSAARRAGVEIANSAVEVAQKAPVILTSLPKPQALAATARAIAAAKLPRRTIVEMSTFMIEDKERAKAVLEKAGHVVLDTPVSGTGAQAKTRDLIFYGSGDKAAIRRLRPMFKTFGREIYDVGEFGNGSRMKYVANLLVAINNVASAEAMVLGMKSGLPRTLDFRPDQRRRRQLARVRTACADDGERPLRASHHEDRRLAKGHAGDRRFRQTTRRRSSPVPGQRADLRQSDHRRIRQRRHRGGLRRAGDDGRI